MAAEFLREHGIDLQYEMSKVQFGDAREDSVSVDDSTHVSTQPIHTLRGVRWYTKEPSTLWDITISAGKVTAVVPHHSLKRVSSVPPETLDFRELVLAPSLCHPHIHLDKCFLLSDPKYSDLEIVKGDFPEALALTSKAKSRFTEDDLLRRGRWLIAESVAAGVTCMRAFVEVDVGVRFKCLDAGLTLKEQFKDCCEIQLCVFAQEPVRSRGNDYPEGAALIEEALRREGVDVLGSTPYVEEDESLMRANVDWAVSTALKHRKHLDLHLDYNLDPRASSLVGYVIEVAKVRDWTKISHGKTIVLGHCNRLTLLSTEEWHSIRTCVADLPISFIGLPTSDLYMMGKPEEESSSGQRVRGTLQVPEMIEKYDLNGAIGVNNVGNAFTPQGNCDPISLASMGVGLYHAGTKKDTELLYVSRNQSKFPESPVLSRYIPSTSSLNK